MKKNEFIYRINEIPDPFDPEYMAISERDVLTSVGRDFEHILRTISNLPSGSVSLAIRFVYCPKPIKKDIQSRLNIYIIATTHNDAASKSMRLLLERGPLTRFYKLEPLNKIETHWKQLKAICDITRREEAVDPLHKPEFNDKIPPYYYTIHPLKPNDQNDYLSLDRILGAIEEKVVIDFCVQPTDVSAERALHTRYLSQLQSINRTWDRYEDDDAGIQDYFGNESSYRPSWKQGLKPMRHPDPLADDILRSQQRFHESLYQPHLLFHIRVLAESSAVAHLIGSTVAESAFEEGSYRLLPYEKDMKSYEIELQSVKNVCVNKTPLHHISFQGKDLSIYSGFEPLSQVAIVDELLGAFRMPVASAKSPCCIRKNTDPPGAEEDNLIVLGHDLELPGINRGLSFNLICNHGLFCGTTGSRKTTAMFNFIFQIHQLRIPFLVIETAKTEYRKLKTFKNHRDKDVSHLAKHLEVYTPGDETISPFRLNPFELLPGISLDEHIDNLLSAFKATIPIEGPLSPLLGEGVEQVYNNHPDRNSPPTMIDLYAASESVLAGKGYSPETNSDIRTALEVRLGLLTRRTVGKIFQCKKSFPNIEHLIRTPTVIELDRLDDYPRCIVTLFILLYIREYLKTSPNNDKDPRLVIIIEEAHNVVGRTRQTTSSDAGDPKGSVAEYICSMLVELRALGVGIYFVEQHPSELEPIVIKSTNLKLCLRQVHEQDRDEIGASMILGPIEREELSRLKAGEGFFYTEGYHKARKIKTVNIHKDFDFSTLVQNKNILPFICEDAWFKKSAFERTKSELLQLGEKMDRFDDGRFQILQKLTNIFARYPLILAQTQAGAIPEKLTGLIKEANDLKERLKTSYASFLTHSYRRYITPEIGSKIQDPLILEMRNNLENRFESTIKTDVNKNMNMINVFINRCQKAAG